MAKQKAAYENRDNVPRLHLDPENPRHDLIGLPMYRKGLIYYAQVKRRANELLILAPRLNAPEGIGGQVQVAA